jgi:hypothetical protein
VYKVDKSLLRKDKVPLVDYYKAWDKVDFEEEIEKADNTTGNVVKSAYESNEGKSKGKNIGVHVVGGGHRSLTVLEDMKNQGNEFFKQREYVQAIDKYSEALVPFLLTIVQIRFRCEPLQREH